MFDNLDLGRVLTDGLHTVVVFVPKMFAFLAILATGWIAALMLQKVCVTVLDRSGFDRAVERGGIRRWLARSNYDASDLLAKLVFYSVLLCAAQIAFGVWGPNPVSDLIKGLVSWLPRAAIAIVMIVVAAAVARAVRDVVGSALRGLRYGRTLGTVASTCILGLGVIAALNQVGVALSVTMPILIAVLATIGGILVVGAGGGLVRPMQHRWERWLGLIEQESAQIAEHARAYAAGQNDTSTQYVGAPTAQTYVGTAHPMPHGDWPTLEPTGQPTAGQPGPSAAGNGETNRVTYVPPS